MKLLGLLGFTLIASISRRSQGVPTNSILHNQNMWPKCSLYLAPSSIPQSGFGIYTTRDIRKGEYINRHLDSPSIVIIDNDDSFKTHLNYLWAGNMFAEYESLKPSVFNPSWSSYCNYHTYLNNIIHAKSEYNDQMVSRFNDSSAGSFSYHDGTYFTATRNIKAGEELFANYGEHWLDYRTGTFTDDIPREEEFEIAGKILERILIYQNDTSSALEDVQLSRIKSIVEVMNPRVASLLPVSIQEINVIKKLSAPAGLKPMAARLAISTINHDQNKVEWIQENGLCMDNVRAGVSSIPKAGRGAFATRLLPKGSLITPAPLLHIMENYNPKNRKSNQLLINYCFGHDESIVLLCPMSSLALMNHCSTRLPTRVGFCDPAVGPNARVKWASEWYPSNAKWLNMTLSELYEMYTNSKSGLAFEVIALRDIYPDEEIFIDYGNVWERAWDNHVQSWRPKETEEFHLYQSVTAFLQKSVKPRTIHELINDPYPSNIMQVCYFDADQAEMYGSKDNQYGLTVEDGSIFAINSPLLYEDYVYPCDLLQRDDESTGEVVVVPHPDNKEKVLIKKYPLAAITFRPKPYTSDQHLDSAFRHFISINEDIFPDQWKSTEKSNEQLNPSLTSTECALYMAPSSIPKSGFGVYTTKLILPGQSIVVEDAPSILVIDSTAHNNGTEVNWSVVDYAWSGESDTYIISFNLGALVNYHTVLRNMKPHPITQADVDYENRNERVDPSNGAYSQERGYNFKAASAIFPGEEIFGDYGESWLDTRPDSFADSVPRLRHYDEAVTILKRIVTDSKNMGLDLNETIYSLILNIVKASKPVVANVLPTTAADVNKFIDVDDSTHIRSKLAESTINKEQHSVEWVKQNGLCLENIVPRKSTIPHAGQGAFAARFLPKDSLITPAPLIQIPDRKSILTYDLIEAEDGKTLVRKNDTPIGSQLLLNYCFGHSDSRLLLYPLTNVILINHCSSRKAGEGECGTKGPNAKIQWAGSWDPSSAEWLHKSLQEIDQLTAEGMRGLSFDVVATRDIHPGEEIFIDYGVEWEYAWEEHVRTWEVPEETESTWKHSKLIPLLEDIPEIRTMEEQVTNPYPENIVIGCYYDASRDLENWTIKENEYWADGSIFEASEENDSSANVYDCEIIDKQSDEKLTVRILYVKDYVDTPVVLVNYPVSSVSFRTRIRGSDQHLLGAFRHHICITDEMFPSQWKDAAISSPRSEL